MKVCKSGVVCGKLPLQPSCFGPRKAGRTRDGLDTICRKCRAAIAKSRRALGKTGRSESKVASRNAHQSKECARISKLMLDHVHAPKMVQEAAAIQEYKAAAVTDVLTLQAGTAADGADRPVGELEDLWLPFQAKTTCRQEPPFVYRECHLHAGRDILCFKNGMVVPFSSEFVAENQTNLLGGKNISLGIRGKSGVWGLIEPEPYKIVSQQRASQWYEEYYQHCNGGASKLQTEQQMRTDGTENMQREYWQITLSMMFDADAAHEWADEPYAVWDRCRNGMRIQDKLVASRKTGDCFFTAGLQRGVASSKVPYVVGDLAGGFFNFGAVLPIGRLYLEWRIPEADMDQHGMLSRLSNGTCAYAGKRAIVLHVATAAGKNRPLCIDLFGKLPRQPFDSWTAQYLSIHHLPDSFVVPECLQGR